MDNGVPSREALVEMLKGTQQPVVSDDLMAEAGRKVLLGELIQMLEHEDGSRTGDDIEDVHDMRVAIRRMRSAFRLLTPYFKSKAIAPYSRQLRKVARTLGTVRDLDVLIADLSQYAKDQPDEARAAMELVIARLDNRRSAARKRLNDAFDRGAYRRFVEDFGAFLTSPGKGARSVDDDTHPVQVRHVLPELIYHHLGAVRAYDGLIADADLTTIHALRIEFKRLRYAVSLFNDVLGSTIGDFITELKAIQDHLGRLNDLTVARERLTDVMSELDPDADAEAQAALQRYLDSLESEQQTLREGAANVWHRFNTKKVQRNLAMAVAGL